MAPSTAAQVSSANLTTGVPSMVYCTFDRASISQLPPARWNVSSRQSDVKCHTAITTLTCSGIVTKPGCPPQSVSSSIAVTKAVKAQGKPFQGQAAVIAQPQFVPAVSASSGISSGAVLVAGIIAILALVAAAVFAMRKNE